MNYFEKNSNFGPMEGINRVILQGNLGGDPEVRVLESGIKVAKFNLATNESYVDSTGKRIEHTEWHNVVAWREVANYVHQHLRVGSLVRLEGKIRSRSTTGRVTGARENLYEIVANSVQLLRDDTIAHSEVKNAWGHAPAAGSPRPEARNSEREEIAPAPPCADNLPF